MSIAVLTILTRVMPGAGASAAVAAGPPASMARVITVGDAATEADGVAVFTVHLGGIELGGAAANNAQVDIIFPAQIFQVSDGSVCTIAPRLAHLVHTETLPRLPDPGVGNQRLRLSVIDTVQPLGDVTDGLLYTCRFPVRSGTLEGKVELAARRHNIGDTLGRILPSSTVGGTVTIGDAEEPMASGHLCFDARQCASRWCTQGICCTSPSCRPGWSCRVSGHEGQCVSTTAIPPEPSPRWTPTPPRVEIRVGQSIADRGHVASFGVTLAGTSGWTSAASSASVDLLLDPAVFELDSGPFCAADPRLHAAEIAEVVLVGGAPSHPRSILRVELSARSPEGGGGLFDGPLYQCRVPIDPAAPVGASAIVVPRAAITDATGQEVPAHAIDGSVRVFPVGTPTYTPTPAPQGQLCLTDAHCRSGVCIQQFCCEQRCLPFERCDVPGRFGLCTALEASSQGCQADSDCISGKCIPPHCATAPASDGASLGAADGGVVDTADGCALHAVRSSPSNQLWAWVSVALLLWRRGRARS